MPSGPYASTSTSTTHPELVEPSSSSDITPSSKQRKHSSRRRPSLLYSSSDETDHARDRRPLQLSDSKRRLPVTSSSPPPPSTTTPPASPFAIAYAGDSTAAHTARAIRSTVSSPGPPSPKSDPTPPSPQSNPGPAFTLSSPKPRRRPSLSPNPPPMNLSLSSSSSSGSSDSLASIGVSAPNGAGPTRPTAGKTRTRSKTLTSSNTNQGSPFSSASRVDGADDGRCNSRSKSRRCSPTISRPCSCQSRRRWSLFYHCCWHDWREWGWRIFCFWLGTASDEDTATRTFVLGRTSRPFSFHVCASVHLHC